MSNGKNVSPEELENKLLALPNILEVVVSAQDGVLAAEIYAEQQEGIQESVMVLNKSMPSYQHIQRALLNVIYGGVKKIIKNTRCAFQVTVLPVSAQRVLYF